MLVDLGISELILNWVWDSFTNNYPAIMHNLRDTSHLIFYTFRRLTLTFFNFTSN